MQQMSIESNAVNKLSKEELEILNDLKSMHMAGNLKGVFSDIPSAVYHLCPGVSSTQLKAVWARMNDLDYLDLDSESDALRFGQAFHSYLLEPRVFNESFRITQKLQPSDLQLKSVSFSEFDVIKAMTKSFFENKDASELIKDSMKEVSFFSIDSETGLLKKCRPDILKSRIGDIKTTQKSDSFSFAQSSKRLLYRLSAAYYLEIISEVYNKRFETFDLVACEKKPPYKVKVYRVSQRSLEEGSLEAREALRMTKRLEVEGESAWKDYDRGIRELLI